MGLRSRLPRRDRRHHINDKARRFVEPLAEEVEAPILMPLDVSVPGQMEAVFERIAEAWGEFETNCRRRASQRHPAR